MVQSYSRRGGEALVNTTTQNDQLAPVFAPLASGGFVAVWVTWISGEIRAQRYDATGAKVGGEISVNSFNTMLQMKATVTGLEGGGFVVTWAASGDPRHPNQYGTFAQIFDPAGAKLGDSFALGLSTTSGQFHPDVAALPGGGFVAAWSDAGDIRAQRFDAVGARVGSEFVVNTTLPNSQMEPAVAVFADGGFVVAWSDNAGITGLAIRAQRFDASGTAIGGELLVNTVAANTINPAIATLAGGGFVVTWVNANGYDVRAQVYDANGAKLGSEFAVNLVTTSEQGAPSVSALPWGGFIISWHDFSMRPDDLSGAIRAQIFDASGARVGDEFLVNSVTNGDQQFPDVAVLASGAFVVGWTDKSGSGGDGSGSGVKLQIYDPALPPTDIALSISSVDEADIAGLAVGRITSDAGGTPTYTLVSDSSGGAFAVVGDRLVLQDNRKLDFEAGGEVSVTLRVTDPNGDFHEETIVLAVGDSSAEPDYLAGAERLANAAVAGEQMYPSVAAFAGGWVYTWMVGGNIRAQMRSADGTAIGGEFTPPTNQGNQQLLPVVAGLESGGFVIAWNDSSGVGGDSEFYAIKAQMYDAAGVKLGGEMLVNLVTAGWQSGVSLAALPGGGFVATWTDESHSNEPGYGVRARLFDGTGAPLTGEIKVNGTTIFDQEESSVVALAGGGFVVTWTDEFSDANGSAIMGQLFDADGTKLGAEFLVNTTVPRSQLNSSVAALPSGGFVVAWADEVGFGIQSNSAVMAQMFDAAGQKVGPEFVVSPQSAGGSGDPQVIGLPWGGFAIAWTDRSGTGDDLSDASVRMQLYDGAGGLIGNPVQLNSQALNGQAVSGIAVAPDGSIAISWTDFGGLGDGSIGIEARTRILTLPPHLVGGPGDDFLVAAYGDSVVGGAGRDLLSIDFSAAPAGVNADFRTLGGGVLAVGGATIGGVETVWRLVGSDHDDLLAPVATAGSEGVQGSIHGRGGNDTIYTNSLSGSVFGGSGNDVIDATLSTGNAPLFGDEGNDIIDGGSGGEAIFGGAGDDDLHGGAGNDRIDGGSGADAMAGGTGDDLFYVDALGDSVAELAGEGVDEVRTSLASYTLGANLEDLTGLGALGQTLTGNGLANVIDGGLGADAMTGGLGNDTYVVDNAGDSVAENAGEGTDEVRTSLAAYNLNDVANIENLTGIAATGQTLTGNGVANVIVGAGGNDMIDGGLGADTMSGGKGSDRYVVDNGADIVVELAAEGTADEIVTGLAAYSLVGHANIERLTGTGSAGQVLTGNGLDNVLTGGSGNDLIDGGAGFDVMGGGAGNDVFIVDSTADSIVEAAGGGVDEVRTGIASYSIVPFANVENLTGTGSADQYLTGNVQANVIDGGLGADTMEGGQGDDVYFVDNVDDFVIEFSGAANGSDEVRTALATFSLTSFFSVERLTGLSAGGQTLTGNGSANVINGGSGNDLIDGGFGADTMAGGLGDDVYIADNGGDVVTELAGAGEDEVRTLLASFSIAGFANVERLTGFGGSDQSLTGNALDNIIDGGIGADVLAGGLGNDVYLLDDAGDVVTEAADQGLDEVRTDLASYSLAAVDNVENLTGGAGDQSLSGNGLDNRIDGGAGADAMAGAGGHDIYIVDNAGDTVTELDGAGTDEVRTGLAAFSLAGFANVENLTGAAGDQTLTGNGSNNVIDGGAGADAMAGGGGHDVYIVDNLGDTIIEVDGAGTDEVRTNLGSKAPPERAVYVLPDFIENLTGTSAGAQGVRDNSLDNVIVMGNGHDLVVADSGGVDTINGGGGNDFVYHGDKLTAADITNGGAGIDTIALLGDYGAGLTFTASNLVGVERMALYTSLYLPGTGPNNYAITMHDANVAVGTEFFVTAASLQSNEVLTFNGAAETNGRFTVHGGGGADTIIGGAGGDFFLGNGGIDTLYGLGGTDFLIGGLGADLLRGGAGADRFVYQSTAQSTTGSVDRILDFQHVDRIDLTGIDANGNAGDGNSAFTFIGSDAFHNVAGELRAYQSGADWFVEGDVNGDGLADLVIQVTLPDATPMGAGDFFL